MASFHCLALLTRTLFLRILGDAICLLYSHGRELVLLQLPCSSMYDILGLLESCFWISLSKLRLPCHGGPGTLHFSSVFACVSFSGM